MPLNLNIDPRELAATASRTDDAWQVSVARSLLIDGRARVTVVSAATEAYIAVHLTCKRKQGRWSRCGFAEADAVYIDQPLGGDAGTSSIGTYYPRGKWAGAFFYGNGVDKARVWAARFVLEQAAGRDFGTGQATALIGKKCLVCGHDLDDKDSIARGIGPECYGAVTRGMAHVRGTEFAPIDSAIENSASAQPRLPVEQVSPRDERVVDYIDRQAGMDQPPADPAPEGLVTLAPGQSAAEALEALS